MERDGHGKLQREKRARAESGLTDAGCDGGAALLVALGTAVAGEPRHAVLAGALACGLVTRLARCSHRVAITGCHQETKPEGRQRQRDLNSERRPTYIHRQTDRQTDKLTYIHNVKLPMHSCQQAQNEGFHREMEKEKKENLITLCLSFTGFLSAGVSLT